jgi:DNA-binding NarL/FixJ family response regulator
MDEARKIIMRGIETLTPRQLEVMNLLVEGATNKRIAFDLGISVETVRRHIYAARLKTGVDNRIQLIVLYAVWRYGLTVIGNCADGAPDLSLEAR